MIFVKNTPNNTGVAIYGDQMDFENLYEALHEVVGNEDEFVAYDAARMRVLGVCYDICRALIGDREIEFVDNGMDDEKKRRMSVLAPDKNVYLEDKCALINKKPCLNCTWNCVVRVMTLLKTKEQKESDAFER